MNQKWRERVALFAILAGPLGLVASFGPDPTPVHKLGPVRPYDFEAVLRRARAELDADPNGHPSLYLYAARAARRAERLDEVEPLLSEAERRSADPQSIVFERLLLRGQRGYAREVRPRLSRALEGHGPIAELAWEALGRGHLRAYQLEEARECFDALVLIQPRSIPGWIGRAEVVRQTPWMSWGPGSANAAIPDLEHVLQLDPTHPEALIHMAEGLMLELDNVNDERSRSVTRQLYPVLGRLPDSADARSFLARVLLQSRQFDEARAVLDAFLTHQPNSVPVLRTRGKLADAEGKESEAIAWYRRVLALTPTDKQASYRIARYILDEGGEEKPRKMLERVGELFKAEQELETLKLQMLGRGRFRGRSSSNEPALRQEAGRLCMTLGREEEATLWWQRALIEDSAYRPAHRALADYYDRVNRPDLARTHREQGGP